MRASRKGSAFHRTVKPVKGFNTEVFFGSGFTFRTPQISVLRLSYHIQNNTGNELITLH
jgi:hypothetical protein